MKPIYKMWFSSLNGLCGLVVAEDDKTKERHAYFGVALGLDEDTDTNMVIETGTKIELDRLREVVKLLAVKPKEVKRERRR